MNKLFLLVLFFSICAFSSEKQDEHDEHENGHEHAHGSSKAIGDNKAITVVDDTNGFKISAEAFKSLKIKLEKMSGTRLLITKETLVTSKNAKGIYRFRDNFFKFIPVEIIKEDHGKYLVETSHFKDSDEVVVEGVNLLRVTDIYSTDTAEYGHGH